jgi:hypothetical protein
VGQVWCLKRTIRHADASDPISRSVAALADTPKASPAAPPNPSLNQAVAVITAARTLPVIMELRPGLGVILLAWSVLVNRIGRNLPPCRATYPARSPP